MKLPEFPVEGGCQCGAVRYLLKARPLVVYACHCKDCQRFSGTTHTLSMFVKADDIELITGELRGYDKAADSGRTVRMLGCIECGTKIWNEPLSFPGILVVRPGTLDVQAGHGRWATSGPTGRCRGSRSTGRSHISRASRRTASRCSTLMQRRLPRAKVKAATVYEFGAAFSSER